MAAGRRSKRPGASAGAAARPTRGGSATPQRGGGGSAGIAGRREGGAAGGAHPLPMDDQAGPPAVRVRGAPARTRLAVPAPRSLMAAPVAASGHSRTEYGRTGRRGRDFCRRHAGEDGAAGRRPGREIRVGRARGVRFHGAAGWGRAGPGRAGHPGRSRLAMPPSSLSLSLCCWRSCPPALRPTSPPFIARGLAVLQSAIALARSPWTVLHVAFPMSESPGFNSNRHGKILLVLSRISIHYSEKDFWLLLKHSIVNHQIRKIFLRQSDSKRRFRKCVDTYILGPRWNK